jgi:integrase/recombinase XerD
MVITMKPTDLATWLTSYLSRYLPGQRNVSVNTIRSYRDTFKLLLIFCQEKRGIAPEYLSIANFTEDLIYDFLTWIEQERKCGISTRNQRLAAVHAFFRYIQIQAILSIPFKKSGRPMVAYLTPEALKSILEQPNRSTSIGRRDLVLLVVLYDTGARVQELIDLVVKDIRLETPSIISLTGKGHKTRHVPLMAKTTKMLFDYLTEHNLLNSATLDHPVFYNKQRRRLTRAGVTYIIHKYTKISKIQDVIPLPNKITPHVFRHTKAMHLLQANVNLIYIRDLLGHVNVTTTEMYARADTEMKRLALEKVYLDAVTDDIPEWSQDKDLLGWLQNFCNQ